MIDAIVSFSIRQRWLVMIIALGMAALGAWNFTQLPIDAVPDITNVQVEINTSAAGYSPLEVEQRITFPMETAMGGLPRLDYTRSLSRYGLSQVTVVFKDGTDIYFARQLVNERIQQVRAATNGACRPRGRTPRRTGHNLLLRPEYYDCGRRPRPSCGTSTLTGVVPENPMARAAAGVRSIIRLRLNGPRSLIVTITERPLR
jgi:hypothetical protein